MPVSSLDRFEAEYVKPKRGRTLIVGSQVYPGREDRRSRFWYPLGVDIQDGPGVDLVADLEEPQPDLGQFDHIECLSVLEHTRRPWVMAEVLTGLLVPGGTIFVAVPFVHRVHGYPNDFWRMTPDGLRSIFPAITWDAVLLASTVLRESTKVPALKKDDHPYLARTETVGFGVLS